MTSGSSSANNRLRRVRQAIQGLISAARRRARVARQPLHRQFIRTVRRRPWAFAYSDQERSKLSRLRALTGVIALGRRLRPYWIDQARIGVLLPPGVPAALVNIAATAAGRSVVNLNYTAGQAGMTAAVRQADLNLLITARPFLEKANIAPPEGISLLYIEDLAHAITSWERLQALLMALTAPIRWIERVCGATRTPDPEDELTVIFSSGSTGEPKGAVLTYDNLGSNVEAAGQAFNVDRDDRLLGILPFFHAFGYMILWFTASRGLGGIFYPNPVDAEAIGQRVAQHRVTLLIATPTCLQLYLRRCKPEQFDSLKMILTGAEKLPSRLAHAFEERFGIRPIEGYGVTECSPVVATNALDLKAPHGPQPGIRLGTVGRPLPGVSVSIVEPQSFEPLGTEQSGLLLVKGPNVMRGYLGREDLTRQVMWHGWYVTGDIATLHEDGFLSITDRLARFSKIGGEMVPHGYIEQALHEAADRDEQVFAVTGVPDEQKGESLAVLHTLDEGWPAQLVQRLNRLGLPKLFIPRPEHFIKVDHLPVLGTGKLDLRATQHIARERLQC